MCPSVIPADARYESLAERFRPVFARIGVDALDRERREVLAHEQLGWLVDAGFARIRTPRAHGGDDVPLSDVFRLIAELAEVDPNLAHIWRNHFSFVEDRRAAARGAVDADLFRRLGAGEIVGGGWSETASAVDGITTRLRADPAGGHRVSGAKYYSTGSVYARWITVLAVDDSGERFIALVDATDPGVTIGDDWDGFGQRLTGSGSVRYDDVHVPDDRVIPYAERYPYQEQYYQTVMHAILVGIGRAIVRDGVAALRARARSHRAGTTVEATRDPEILETIGVVAARSYAADAAFAAGLPLIDAAVAAHEAGAAPEVAADLGTRSWIAVAQTQSVVTDAVLDAATLVFDALGASGTGRTTALDRHWRNARTLASHNPRIFKRRIVGDHLVNGTDPLG
jgi:alkylation response protein AidB-like acyl-CoA dehydrogenase